MYKVTAYFKNYKISKMFYSVYDAIDFRESADAHYPKKVEFKEGVFSMREWIYDCWALVMDDRRNPLSNIPDLMVRHLIMQVLAWMWCIAFAIIVGSYTVFAISAIAHVALIAAVVVTVGTFKVAEHKPEAFEFVKGYHSYGRGRKATIFRDKEGKAHKVALDEGDPGGEHE